MWDKSFVTRSKSYGRAPGHEAQMGRGCTRRCELGGNLLANSTSKQRHKHWRIASASPLDREPIIAKLTEVEGLKDKLDSLQIGCMGNG